jgi:hypothetical protein
MLAVARRNLIRPNPFRFPGGKTGFNPNHIALVGGGPLRFSGISALSGNFIDVMTGAAGSINGSLTPSIDSAIGPKVTFADATTARTDFSGKSGVADASVCLAAIFRFSSGSAFQFMLLAGSASGWGIGTSGGANLSLESYGGSSIDSGLPVATGVPYFAIVSGNASASTFLLLNLSTGQIKTATSTGSSSIGCNGTYRVGNAAGGSSNSATGVSAVMCSANYLSATEALQWAQSPWSFWYS